MKKISKEQVEDIFELTPMQTSMLVAYLNDSTHQAYHEQTRYSLTGPIMQEYLCEAIRIVVNMHPMLRAVYRWKQLTVPLQIILNGQKEPVEFFDVSDETMDEALRFSDDIDQQVYTKKLDLEEQAIRFIVIKLKKDLFHLIIANHHIIFDGWSNGILLKDLLEVYCTLNRGVQSMDINRCEGFKKFVYMQNNIDTASRKIFWKEYFKAYESKEILPFAKHNEKVTGVGHLEFPLDSRLIRKIHRQAAQLGVTVATMLYGVFAALIYQETKITDIVFGATLSCRPLALDCFQQVIGMFINTLPLRIMVTPQKTLREFMKHVARSYIRIEEFKDTPKESLASFLQSQKRLGLYNIAVTIQNYPMSSKVLQGNKELKMELYSRHIATDLPLTIGIRTYDNMTFDFIYQKSFYDQEKIQQLMYRLCELMEKFVEDNVQNQSLGDLLQRDKRIKQSVILQFEEADFNDVL